MVEFVDYSVNRNEEFLKILKNKFGEKFISEFSNLIKDSKEIKKIAIIPENNKENGFGFWVRCDVSEGGMINSIINMEHRFKHIEFDEEKKENIHYQQMYKFYKQLCKKENVFVIYGEDDIEKSLLSMEMKIKDYLVEKQSTFAMEKEIFRQVEKKHQRDLRKFLYGNKDVKEMKIDDDEIFENNEIMFNEVKKVMGDEIIAKTKEYSDIWKIKEIYFVPKDVDKIENGFGFDVYFAEETPKNSDLKQLGIDKSYQFEDYILFNKKSDQNEYKLFLDAKKKNECFKFKIDNEWNVTNEKSPTIKLLKKYDDYKNEIKKQEKIFLEKQQKKMEWER